MSPQVADKLRKALELALAGDDPQQWALTFTGRECVDAHNILFRIDSLLRVQWYAQGEPDLKDLL